MLFGNCRGCRADAWRRNRDAANGCAISREPNVYNSGTAHAIIRDATSATSVADRRRWQDGVRCGLGEAGHRGHEPADGKLKHSVRPSGYVQSDVRIAVVDELAAFSVHDFCLQTDG